MSLPRNLKYGLKVESASARSYLANIQPNGSLGGYKPGSTTNIMIPTGPGLAMVAGENLLRFSVSTIDSTGNSGRLDSCGGHSYIQKIKIYSQSNVLEECENYNLMAKEMFDLQVSSASMGKHSILTGCRSDLYTNGTVATATADNTYDATEAAMLNAMTSAIANGIKTRYINTGQLIETAPLNNGMYTNTNGAYFKRKTYALTLISLLGSLPTVYLPLFALSGVIRLEITWAPSVFSVGAFPATCSDYFVDDIEFIGSYIQLSDPALSAIQTSLNGQPLSFTMQGIKNSNFTYRISAGNSTTVNFNIDAKFGSVKSMICTARNGDTINSALHYPLACCKFNLSSYNFKLGSQSAIPSIPPSTVQQMFAEVLKCIGSLNDVNHCPSIDLDSYSVDNPTINTQATITSGSIHSPSFMIGLDTENFQEADKSTIYTGWDGTKSDCTCALTFGNQGADTNVRFDAFTIYDKQVFFGNGTCWTEQ